MKLPFLKSKRIYLDHSAATPVAKEVLRAMRPFFSEVYGNPSAIHAEGVDARKAIEEARTRVARCLHVRSEQVVFTGGGTESNNLALIGTVVRMHAQGTPYSDIEIISLKTEHPSITRTLDELAERGCIVTYVSVDEDGLLNYSLFQTALSSKTRLVSIAYANSETGVVQDLGRMSRLLKEFSKRENQPILFHTDASQAPLWLPCELDRLGVDLMTLDAGKFCGPKGVGMLIYRGEVPFTHVVHGGSQEFGLRPGTENVPLIVGASVGLTRAQSQWKQRSARVQTVRDYGIEKYLGIDGVYLNGSLDARLANNINISLPGFDTEFAVVTLDAEGIACSTKSACSGAGSGISNVVYAMTGDTARAGATIRLSLGEETTQQDMDKVSAVITKYIKQMSHISKKVD